MSATIRYAFAAVAALIFLSLSAQAEEKKPLPAAPPVIEEKHQTAFWKLSSEMQAATGEILRARIAQLEVELANANSALIRQTAPPEGSQKKQQSTQAAFMKLLADAKPNCKGGEVEVGPEGLNCKEAAATAKPEVKK